MKRTTLIILLTIGCIFANTNVNAMTKKNTEFFVKHSTGYSLTKLNFKDTKTKANNFPNFNFGLGFQYKMLENSLEFNYNNIFYKYKDSDDASNNFDGIVKVYTVTYNINLLLKNSTIFTPYVGAGLGIDIIHSKIVEKTNVNLFSYAARGGCRVAFNENTDFDLNVQYNSSTKKSLKKNADAKIQFTNISFNAGAVVKF